MFPIPSGRNLSFFDIAKYWSREIKPSAPSQELLIAIGQAWWRGELVAANGPSRLNLLRALYSTCRDAIAFIIPDMPEPPGSKVLDDGRWEVFLRVPLPNADPDTWTEANCAEALEVIAKAWDNEEPFHLIAPIVAGITMTQGEFNHWIGKMNYTHPTFWGEASEKENEQQPIDNTVPRICITKAQPETAISRAAWQGINALWPEGPPKNLQTADIHRKVNKWIEKHPREIYPFTNVSRETIARLLGRK